MNNLTEFWLQLLKHNNEDSRQVWNTYMKHRCKSEKSTLASDCLRNFHFGSENYNTFKPLFESLESSYGCPNFPESADQCFVNFSEMEFPCGITLSGLALIGVDFRKTKFQRKVDFSNSRFLLNAKFNESKFSDHSKDKKIRGWILKALLLFGKARFCICQFSGVTNFSNTKFHKQAYFSGSNFGDTGTDLGTSV